MSTVRNAPGESITMTSHPSDASIAAVMSTDSQGTYQRNYYSSLSLLAYFFRKFFSFTQYIFLLLPYFLCDTFMSSTCHTKVSFPSLVQFFAAQGLYGFIMKPYLFSSIDNLLYYNSAAFIVTYIALLRQTYICFPPFFP